MALKDLSDNGFITQLLEIVEEHLDNPDFSIEQLCREAGVSRTQLHRKIKAATRLSTSHFIRKVRMEKAKELLEQTDDNITEIAYRTGNSSPQNFSKYFTKEFGVSPSHYRKQLTKRPGKQDNAGSNNPDPDQSPALYKGGEKGRSRRQMILLSLLILAALLTIWAALPLPEESSISTDNQYDPAPSIAVIPFQNYGPESDAFFCEGIVEDILTYLTQFEGLKVISRTSTAKFKDTKTSIRQIAEELQVNYVLEGSVRQDSAEVRVTAQLIRAIDDQHVWAHRYDRPKKNVMDLQAEIARDIAAALNQSISPVLQEKFDHPPTRDIEAYNAVLRGRFLQRSRTKEGLYRSIEQFNTALQLDSNYSDAFAGKAAAYNLLANLRYEPAREKEYQRLSEWNALQAIKNDKNNGLAYGILGNIYAQQYRWEESIAAFEIALGLSPNDAILNYWFSLALRYVGALERSLQYHRLASDLDPLHPVIQAGYIYTCILAREFALADQIMEKVEPIMGESFLYYYVQGFALMEKGDYAAALEAMDVALSINPEFRQSETNRIYCLGRLGQVQQVVEYISALDTTQALSCLRAAKAYLSLDDIPQSIRFLEQAASFGLVPEDVLSNSIYDPLRNHPAFKEILQQFNYDAFLPSSPESVADPR